MGRPGLFDLDERYQRLSENGDPLAKLAALIDFEAFRLRLATALKRSDGSKGGRPLAAFDAWLKGKGYLAMSGQIIDASIIAAPRQRDADAEKAALKEGQIPEAWVAKPKKLAQKDRDAR